MIGALFQLLFGRRGTARVEPVRLSSRIVTSFAAGSAITRNVSATSGLMLQTVLGSNITTAQEMAGAIAPSITLQSRIDLEEMEP